MDLALTQAASSEAGMGHVVACVQDESQGARRIASARRLVNIGILKRRLFFPKSAFFAGWPV